MNRQFIRESVAEAIECELALRGISVSDAERMRLVHVLGQLDQVQSPAEIAALVRSGSRNSFPVFAIAAPVACDPVRWLGASECA